MVLCLYSTLHLVKSNSGPEQALIHISSTTPMFHRERLASGSSEETFKAMPDFRYTLKKIVADRDLVFIHCTTTATHTGGEWLGVRPSGNKLNFDVVDIFRIQDGLIAEHWDVADTYTCSASLAKSKR